MRPATFRILSRAATACAGAAVMGLSVAAPAPAEAPPASGAVAAASAVPASAAAPASSPLPSDPTVQRQVHEDDNVRIEELRVRGQDRRLVVQPKIEGVAPYEITPADPARDTTAARGSSGQRVWRLFSF